MCGEGRALSLWPHTFHSFHLLSYSQCAFHTDEDMGLWKTLDIITLANRIPVENDCDMFFSWSIVGICSWHQLFLRKDYWFEKKVKGRK